MSDIVCLSINCKFELVSVAHFLNVAGSFHPVAACFIKCYFL